jgi:hypothetical protein
MAQHNFYLFKQTPKSYWSEPVFRKKMSSGICD